MSEPTYPFGYKRPENGGPQGLGTMLTWAECMTKTTVNRLHPEVQRRFHALIEFGHEVGVPLGVGTGWRVQPDPPPAGFAKPGNSWHESSPVNPPSATAIAIDTVPNISWDWMQVHCGRYGLRSFRYVNNESWHLQPAEAPTSRKFATKVPPLTVWPLPGPPPVTSPVPPSVILEEDSMLHVIAPGRGATLLAAGFRHFAHDEEEQIVMERSYGKPVQLSDYDYDILVDMAFVNDLPPSQGGPH